MAKLDVLNMLAMDLMLVAQHAIHKISEEYSGINGYLTISIIQCVLSLFPWIISPYGAHDSMFMVILRIDKIVKQFN